MRSSFLSYADLIRTGLGSSATVLGLKVNLTDMIHIKEVIRAPSRDIEYDFGLLADVERRYRRPEFVVKELAIRRGSFFFHAMPMTMANWMSPEDRAKTLPRADHELKGSFAFEDVEVAFNVTSAINSSQRASSSRRAANFKVQDFRSRVQSPRSKAKGYHARSLDLAGTPSRSKRKPFFKEKRQRRYKRTKLTAEQRIPYYMGGPSYAPQTIEFQSARVPTAYAKAIEEHKVAKTEHAERRLARDLLQQQIAASKAKLARQRDYKSIPKRDRATNVRTARDKRSTDPYEEQSGGLVPTVVGLGGALLFKKIFQLVGKAEKTFDGLSAVMNAIKSKIEDLRRQVGDFLCLTPLIMSFFWLLKKTDLIPNGFVTLILASLAGICGKYVWGAISNFFREGNGTLDFQSGVFDSAPKLLSTLFVFSSLKGKVNQSSVGEFTRRLANIGRLSDGWETFIDWVTKATQCLINTTRKLFGKDAIDFVNAVDKPFNTWVRDVDDMCKKYATDADPTGDDLDAMVRMINLGFGFKESFRNTRMQKPVEESLSRVMSLLVPFQGALQARNNFRVEPVPLLLYSQPGAGKTLLSLSLCAAVLKLSGLCGPNTTADDVIKNIWQKGNSEYWNSYAGQHCFVADDAFQQRDPQGSDNDYLNFIRMVGSWSMPLNFADLTSKGRIFFNSKFMYLTTNLGSLSSEAEKVIIDPDAVLRRIKYGKQLVVNPEYRKVGSHALDYSKYQKECADLRNREVDPIDAFPWYIWSVQDWDFKAGRATGGSQPLKALVLEVARELKERLDSHQDAKVSLKTFIEGLDQQAVAPVTNPGEGLAFQAGVVCGVRSVSKKITSSGIAEAAKSIPKKTVQTALFSYKQVMKLWDEHKAEVKLHCNLWKPFLKVVGCFIAVNIAITGFLAISVFIRDLVLKFFGTVTGRKKNERLFESNRPDTKPAGKKNRRVLQSGGADDGAAIYNSTYKMYTHLKNNKSFTFGQVIFLVSDLAVMPDHFNDSIQRAIIEGVMDESTVLHFKHCGQERFNFSMSVGKFVSLKKSSDSARDVSFVQFRDVRSHLKVWNRFIQESDVTWLSGNKAFLELGKITTDGKGEYSMHRHTMNVGVVKGGKNLPVQMRVLERYLEYDANTVSGDCGAPLCLLDSRSYSGRHVIGMHVCGETTGLRAFSNVVTQEMIKKAMAALSTIEDRYVEDMTERGIAVQTGGEIPFPTPGSFLPIGTVEAAINISPKTSYYPVKELYGIFGEYDYAPAPLSMVYRDGERKYPMFNAVLPYSSPVLIYENRDHDQIAHVAFKPLTLATLDSPRAIYTYEQAILGIPQEKFRSIPRNTSPGYPYVLSLRNGKKEFFGSDTDYTLDTPLGRELRERVELVLEQASRGIRLSHTFMDFLKDELRPDEKVVAVATRLISAAPTDYVIAFRMMFGAFSSAVMKHHTVTGMAPGICTFTDWGLLAQKLSDKGLKIFDGDFKQFDSSEQGCVHRLFLEYINRWYDDGPTNSRIREVLWEELVHSRHIGGSGTDQRHLYQWNKSLPSGHPFTTIVNSMYSLFMLVSAYFNTTGDKTGFWDYVSAVVYGDDNVVNVDDSVAETFNQVTVSRSLWEQYQLRYTSGHKGAELEPYTSLDRITFLKRSIRLERGHFLCPLELDSFLYTCYWCKNRKLEKDIILDVLDNSLCELSMHPQSTWDAYARSIYDLMLRRGRVPTSLCDREAYQAIVRLRSDNWY